jgi:hypothetical protein
MARKKQDFGKKKEVERKVDARFFSLDKLMRK